MFVLDEGDECILHYGSAIDEENEKIIGFWDLFEHKTILLTGTVGIELEDIMNNLFGLKRKSFVDFKDVIA